MSPEQPASGVTVAFPDFLRGGEAGSASQISQNVPRNFRTRRRAVSYAL
jgi:hypothetical protein